MAKATAPAGMVTIKENPNNGIKQTTATTYDGKRYTFAGDNWVNFANENGLDAGNLSQAITTPAGVTANEGNALINENASLYPGANHLKTDYGAGVFDTIGKADAIKEHNRKYPNEQLNPADYHLNASDFGTNYNYVPGITNTGSGVNYNTGSYNTGGVGAGYGYDTNGMPSFNGMSYGELYDMFKGGSNTQTSAALTLLDSINKGYDLDRTNVNDTMDKSNKDAYINMKMAERDLPQLMAASGLTGGLTESSLLGLRSDYGKTYADNERTRISELNKIDANAAKSAAETASAIAGYEAQAAQNAANAYITMVNAENAYNQWAYEMNNANSQYERNFAYQQAQTAYNQSQDSKAEYNGWINDLMNVAIQTEDTALLNQLLGLVGTEIGVDGLSSTGFNASGVGTGDLTDPNYTEGNEIGNLLAQFNGIMG